MGVFYALRLYHRVNAIVYRTKLTAINFYFNRTGLCEHVFCISWWLSDHLTWPIRRVSP